MKARRGSFLWLGLVLVATTALSVVLIANLKLPYGDHIVVATNIIEHSFVYDQRVSKLLLPYKKEPACNITGTFGNVVSRHEGAALQFVIAVWERETSSGWSSPVDRPLLNQLVQRSIEECDVNRYSSEIAPFFPLIYATAARDVSITSKLLMRGANPLQKIRAPGKQVDGLNAIEFATLIKNKPILANDAQVMTEIINLMQQHVPEREKRSQVGRLQPPPLLMTG